MSMDLSRKLDQIKQKKTEALLKQLGGRVFRASDLSDNSPPPPVVSSATELFDSGEIIENELGQVFVRRVTFPPDSEGNARGYCFPASLSNRFADEHTIQRLVRHPEARIPLENWIVLDVETTGLAGGVGTYPFLVGVGWFEDGAFIVEQYFMEDYPFEPALMHHLRNQVADFEGLITYNGKTFDIPLLRTRFIYNRLPSVFEKPNWDLLHGARRLWKRRLRDCSLSNVEDKILGVEHREHDIHGAEIPQLYFDYVRGKRRERMALVFDHNVQDICSLAALALRMAEYYRNPDHEDVQHADDLLGLAGLYEAARQPKLAIECLEKALLLERDPETIYRLSLLIARRYKRLQRWEEAEAIWRAQIDGASFYSIECHVELAKYLEHKRKRHREARQVVDRALRWLETRRELSQYLDNSLLTAPREDPDLAALLHRMGRLERKIRRAIDSR